MVIGDDVGVSDVPGRLTLARVIRPGRVIKNVH
jgi:hypothetical protein